MVNNICIAGPVDNAEGGGGDDKITGNSFSNTLYGNAGADTLDGSAGYGDLRGGGGDDVYHLFDAPHLPDGLYDDVAEDANGGNDTVYVIQISNGPDSYILASNVENGVLRRIQPKVLARSWKIRWSHVVSDVGQDEFRLGPGDADGADEQAEAVFLVGEDVFDMGTDRRFRGIDRRDILRRRPARRLATMDTADQHPRSQPFLVLLRPICAVGPDLRRGVVRRHQPREVNAGVQLKGGTTLPGYHNSLRVDSLADFADMGSRSFSIFLPVRRPPRLPIAEFAVLASGH